MYRKFLLSCVTPLCSNSNRFCAVRLNYGLLGSILLICVYMPSQSSNTCYNDNLSTLGEVEGYLDSQSVAIVGDFNLDFARGGPLVKLLHDFAFDLELVVCDLSYNDDIIL